jgi:hypothetical protein
MCSNDIHRMENREKHGTGSVKATSEHSDSDGAFTFRFELGVVHHQNGSKEKFMENVRYNR